MKRLEGILFFLFISYNSGIHCLSKDLTLNVNLKKPIAVTDEKFLSLTVDPVTLLTGNALSNDFERSVNLAKALTPAYVRLGGPGSSLYSFAGRNSQDAEGNKRIVLSESDLALIHQWAKKAGLDVIACMSPDKENSEDFEDAREVVSFSDHMSFNTNWQLGYECQTKCNISGKNLAKQTVNLRNILKEFPRFSNSILTGPDVAAYWSEKEQKYLQDYFNIAGPVLSAVTWHPDFASVALGNEGVYIRQDNLESDKEELFKVIGRFMKNQPLWIAESKTEECKNLYIGALVLARRLGNAAKLNVNVVMRQPTDLTQPTPDYWVSLLHKNLVGREVFDTKIHASNKNHVYLYCQCTKPSERYKKGSITMFGVNLSPESVAINFKGTKILTVHQYMLSPGMDTPNRMFAETVLLNNGSLNLINDTVPQMDPAILNDPNGLNLDLPSGGIGFWVFPNIKIKSCMENDGAAKKETSLGVRLAKDLNGAENVKVLVTRSVQDRADRLSEKRKQRNGNRVPRRLNLRTEIRKVRDFAKRRLDDYETRSLSKVRGLSDSKEDKTETKRASNADSAQQYQDDMQTKLEEFEERWSRVRAAASNDETKTAATSSLEKLIDDVKSLISRIQTALAAVKKESNFEERKESANTVQDCLKSLYELLTQTKLGDLSDTKVEIVGQKSIRLKRGLLEASLYEDGKESGVYRKIKHRMVDTGARVRPSVIGQRASDSGENTFYGFFKTEPMEGFPEGDVPFATGDYPENRDQDYARDDELVDRSTNAYRGVKASDVAYDDADRVWSDDETDYPFYEPAEFLGKSKVPNNRARTNSDSSELWELQGYGSRTNDRSYGAADIRTAVNWNIQKDNGKWGDLNDDKDISSLVKFKPDRVTNANRQSSGFRRQGRKLADEKTKLPDYGLNSDLKGLDFSFAGGSYGTGRVKRESKDLRDILDQEMIKEDDANSKDCNCRVIRHSKASGFRSKRAATRVAPKPETHLTPIAEIQMPAVLNTDMERDNLREAEDVEVFADVSGPPMQRQNAEIKTPTPQFKRYAEPTFQTESYLEDFEDSPMDAEVIQTYTESNIPILETHSEYARNHKDFHSGTLSVNPSSPINLNDAQDTDLSLKTPVQRDESTFFREEHGKNDEEAKIDIAKSASINEKYNTPLAGEKVAKKKEEAEKAEKAEDTEETEETGEREVQRTETSSTTLKTATLSDETITKESENDYNGDAVGVSSKREVVATEVPTEKPVKVGATNLRSPINTRQRTKSAAQTRSNTARPRESESSKRVRALKALRELMRAFRQGQPSKPSPKLRATNKTGVPARNRTARAQKLNNVRGGRPVSLRRYQKQIPDVADNTEDDQTRYLKRREAGETIKDGEDIKETVDPDNSDYVPTYQPAENDAKPDESKIEESVETIRVPVTDVVRARNIRERIFNPVNQHKSRESTIMERPNPKRLIEKIRKLTSLYDGVAAAEDRVDVDHKGQDKSYFALVEDLDSPRIFYYQEKPDSKEKRAAQAFPSPRSFFYEPGYTYNRPGQRTYERQSLKAAQYSSEEDQEESDKLPEDREIYIIDPSEYKGGDPPLRLYRGPARSRSGARDSYGIVWEPIIYKTYKVRETEQYRREDKTPSQDDEDPQKNVDELLKTVIDNLDSQIVQKLYDQLKKHNIVDPPKENFMRSTAENAEEELSQKNVTSSMIEDEEVKKISENGEISEKSEESFEMTGVEMTREQRQRPQMDGWVEDGTEIREDDTIFGAEIVPESISDNDSQEEDPYEIEGPHIRKKRDTSAWSEERDFEWLPSFVIRKVPRAIQKTSRNNYLCLKDNSGRTAEENSSELYKILKGSDIYKAIPVKKMYDESTSSDEYSSIEEADRILGTGHPYRKLSENYQQSEDGGSKLKKDEENISPEYREEYTSNVQELCNASEEDVRNSEESNENVNLKDLLLSDKSDLLMVLPLAKINDRYRRDTADPERISEISNTEKVQPAEYQHLDESMAPKSPTFSPIDDIEQSLIQKIPLEKFTTKENINKRRNMRKNKRVDEELPALIEKSIPKLGKVVVNSLRKAQNLTGSVEDLIENLDKKYDKTLNSDQQRNMTDPKSASTARNVFHNAITNVKKFFMLLNGVTHLFRT